MNFFLSILYVYNSSLFYVFCVLQNDITNDNDNGSDDAIMIVIELNSWVNSLPNHCMLN